MANMRSMVSTKMNTIMGTKKRSMLITMNIKMKSMSIMITMSTSTHTTMIINKEVTMMSIITTTRVMIPTLG